MIFDVKIARALLSYTVRNSKSELAARTDIDIARINNYCAGKATEILDEDWEKIYPLIQAELPENDAYVPEGLLLHQANEEEKPSFLEIDPMDTDSGNTGLPSIKLNLSKIQDIPKEFSQVEQADETSLNDDSEPPEKVREIVEPEQSFEAEIESEPEYGDEAEVEDEPEYSDEAEVEDEPEAGSENFGEDKLDSDLEQVVQIVKLLSAEGRQDVIKAAKLIQEVELLRSLFK